MVSLYLCVTLENEDGYCFTFTFLQFVLSKERPLSTRSNQFVYLIYHLFCSQCVKIDCQVQKRISIFFISQKVCDMACMSNLKSNTLNHVQGVEKEKFLFLVSWPNSCFSVTEIIRVTILIPGMTIFWTGDWSKSIYFRIDEKRFIYIREPT